MKFSGYQIKSCPNCQQLYKDRIVVSFNTFDVKQYSDGYVEGDWMPKFTNIIKCINKECGQFFRLNDQEKIREITFEEAKDPEWTGAFDTAGCKLGKEQLEEALRTTFCNTQENELIVRTLLNREYNHPLRKDRTSTLLAEERSLQITNLEKLIGLLKDKEGSSLKLTIAEYYREMEEFDFCIATLNGLSGEKEHETVFKAKLLKQAKLMDARVFNIASITPPQTSKSKLTPFQNILKLLNIR